MRLVETCGCGASIELVRSQPKSHYAPQEHFSEAARAEKEISAFRRLHKVCRISRAAEVGASA